MAAIPTNLPMLPVPFQPATSKFALTRSLNFNSNVRNTTKINITSLKTGDGEVSLPSSSSSSSSSISFLKQLQDWDILSRPIDIIFKETKQMQLSHGDAKLIDKFGINSGRLVENGLVFRQSFPIRSYEIGADGKVSLEASMSHLQEVGLNHMKLTGLLGDGLGSTPEMTKRNLIWVATKVQLVIDRNPTWGDDVVIDNWIVPSGKNFMRCDSIICDRKTGEILIRASSNWVIMNKESRRLSRIPKEVREELSSYLANLEPIIENDTYKLPKLEKDTSEYIVTGLRPRWSDLDINQHVNNAKYIGWILESAPPAILENHEIFLVTIEYKRECRRDSELESLTAICGGKTSDFDDLGNVACHHMLRLEGADEVMKARTEWRPRHAHWKPPFFIGK